MSAWEEKKLTSWRETSSTALISLRRISFSKSKEGGGENLESGSGRFLLQFRPFGSLLLCQDLSLQEEPKETRAARKGDEIQGELL